MQRLLILLVSICIFYSCTIKSDKVLLFIRDGSGDLNYTMKAEVGVMKDILEQEGFTVIIVTMSGLPLSTDSAQIIPDLKLSDVEINDYSGIILPCMHAGASLEEVNPLAVKLVKEANLAKIPIAVQHASIMTLAKAGILHGKQYTYHKEVDVNEFPDFEGSKYSGTGVVRDGNIITSGVCPYLEKLYSFEEGTQKLTLTLIDIVNEKLK